MNQNERQALFAQLVQSKVVTTELGQINLPIDGLKEYHDRVGLADNELSYFDLQLPGAEEGLYQYVLGGMNSDEAKFELVETLYYDDTTGESVNFEPPDLFIESLGRKMLNGDVFCNGSIRIDHYGRAWFSTMTSDNIGAVLLVTFNPSNLGVSVYTEDLSGSVRLWYDGKTFHFSPTTLFVCYGYPCWELPRTCAGAFSCGKIYCRLDRRQAVRHWVLVPAFAGSNPAGPAIFCATKNGRQDESPGSSNARSLATTAHCLYPAGPAKPKRISLEGLFFLFCAIITIWTMNQM